MRIYFVKATQFKRSISQHLLYVSRSNFQGILRLPRSFNFKWPVHMVNRTRILTALTADVF